MGSTISSVPLPFRSPRQLSTQPPPSLLLVVLSPPSPPAGREHSPTRSSTSLSQRLRPLCVCKAYFHLQNTPKSSLVKRVRLTPTHIHVERNSRDLDWLLAAPRLQPLSLLSPVTTYDLLCLYSKNRGQSPNSNSNRQRPILTDSLLPLPVQPSFPPSSPLLECQLILPPMAQHLIRFNASRFDLL